MDGGEDQGEEVSPCVQYHDLLTPSESLTVFRSPILRLKPAVGSQEEAGHSSSPPTSEEAALYAARRNRRHITLEGAPLFGFLGTFEWFLVFVGLLVLFTLQYLPALPDLSQLAVRYWLFAAGGYTAMILVHGALIIRSWITFLVGVF